LRSIKKYSVLITYLRQTYGFAFVLSGINKPDDYARAVNTCRFEFFKMDREFTKSLHHPEQVMANWGEIFKKIHDSGSYVIASYIEEGNTLSNAIRVGVDIVQGFLLGDPAPDIGQLNDIDITTQH